MTNNPISSLSLSSQLPVDRTSLLPFYSQIAENLRKRIELGDLKPGDQLPGEPELCRTYQVSRTVIRQALQELTYEGLIIRHKGKGTFVAQPKISEGFIQSINGLYSDMRERGQVLTSKVLVQALRPASVVAASALRIPVNTPVIEIQRLRFIQYDPLVLVTGFFPVDLCSSLLQADLRFQSLYGFLEKNANLVIDHTHSTIEASSARIEEAELLQVEAGSPLLKLQAVSYLADGQPIEYYTALHRGDRSRFEITTSRNNSISQIPGGE